MQTLFKNMTDFNIFFTARKKERLEKNSLSHECDIVDISCYVSWHFYNTNCPKISAEFFQKSTVIFQEVSGKIRKFPNL